MKLLIVDDEPLIHVSIEYSLKELGLGDVEVLHAYTGTDMWKCLEESRIDAALVDIRMPGTNGLEAIEEGKRRWPDTFYYIMSGFSEFEYAREAIRLSVTEYLLKPLEPKTLAAVIAHVKDARANQDNQIRDTFRGWLAGTLHRHDVGYLYAKGYATALLLLTYDNPQNDSWIPAFLYDSHERVLSLPCDEGLLLLIFAPDASLVHEILRKVPKRDYPAGVTCFASPVCREPEKLAAQMRLLLGASPIRVFRGLGVRYDAVLLAEVPEQELAAAKPWISLRDSYFHSQYETYVSLCSRLCASLPCENSERVRSFLTEVTGAALSGARTVEDLTRLLRQRGKSLLSQRKNVSKVDAAVAYLEENFYQDTSLASLAAQFDLTPNYLSTLLKNRLGMKFTDYLAGLRISHAKNLLLTTALSIKEITQQVGYYSESHFIKVFLEREGCTPAEFRSREKDPGGN